MKRDMDLVREILLALEKSDDFEPTPDYVLEALKAKGDLSAQRNVWWHLQLMEQAQLVSIKWHQFDNWQAGEPEMVSVRILWPGYDFLAEASNPEFWDKAKRRAGDAFYSLSIGTLQALLSSVAKQHFGLP